LIANCMKKLESEKELATASVTNQTDSFLKKVLKETDSVNVDVLAMSVEMDSVLSPSLALADDPRCNVFVRVFPKWPELGSSGEQPDEAEDASSELSSIPEHDPPGGDSSSLTTGGLRSHADIVDAFVKFDQTYEDLKGRQHLVVLFYGLVNNEIPVPVNSKTAQIRFKSSSIINVEAELHQKLTAFRNFWRSVRKWDEHVEHHMRTHPNRVCVKKVQSQASATLYAVKDCVETHQALLRERVDSLLNLMDPLSQVQAMMTLFPQQPRDDGSLESVCASNSLVPREDSSSGHPSAKVSSTSLDLTPHESSSWSYNSGVWYDFFEPTSAPTFGGQVSVIEAMKSADLHSLVQTGVLHRAEEVLHHHKAALNTYCFRIKR